MRSAPRLTLRRIQQALQLAPGAALPTLDDARMIAAAQRDVRFARLLELEHARLLAMSEHENAAWHSGGGYVAGADEVGRGPLAGPLVAAAVCFSEPPQIPLLDDSKRLSALERRLIAARIRERALACHVHEVAVDVLATKSLHIASLEAMAAALRALGRPLAHVLIDGCHRIPWLDEPQTALIKGDGRSISIAAASILAKVHRDALMEQLHEALPWYGFAQNKGYGTTSHLEALRQHGASAHHRLGFAPVAEVAARPEQMSFWPPLQ